MPKLKIGDDNANSAIDFMKACDLVSATSLDEQLLCSLSDLLPFSDLSISAIFCATCNTYRPRLVVSVNTKYDDVGSISALKYNSESVFDLNTIVCRHSQVAQLHTLISVLFSLVVMACFQSELLQIYTVCGEWFGENVQCCRYWNLLLVIFAVVVEEEKAGNGFALVWYPLVQASRCLVICVEIHLIETNVAIFETNGQCGTIWRQCSTGDRWALTVPQWTFGYVFGRLGSNLRQTTIPYQYKSYTIVYISHTMPCSYPISLHHRMNVVALIARSTRPHNQLADAVVHFVFIIRYIRAPVNFVIFRHMTDNWIFDLQHQRTDDATANHFDFVYVQCNHFNGCQHNVWFHMRKLQIQHFIGHATDERTLSANGIHHTHHAFILWVHCEKRIHQRTFK